VTTAQAPPAQAALLAEFARRMGRRAAKGLMLGRPGDRQPTREETRAAAAKTTITRFTLTGLPQRPPAVNFVSPRIARPASVRLAVGYARPARGLAAVPPKVPEVRDFRPCLSRQLSAEPR